MRRVVELYVSTYIFWYIDVISIAITRSCPGGEALPLAHMLEWPASRAHTIHRTNKLWIASSWVLNSYGVEGLRIDAHNMGVPPTDGSPCGSQAHGRES